MTLIEWLCYLVGVRYIYCLKDNSHSIDMA